MSEGRTRTLRKSSNEDEQSGRPSLPYMFRLLQIPTVMILHPPQLFLRWIAAKLLLHVAHANIQLSFAQVDDCTTAHVVDRRIYEMKKRRLALAGSSAPMNRGLCSRSFSRRRRLSCWKCADIGRSPCGSMDGVVIYGSVGLCVFGASGNWRADVRHPTHSIRCGMYASKITGVL